MKEIITDSPVTEHRIITPGQKKGDSVSARARFFKKVQQQTVALPTDGSVDTDIQAFCQRMAEFAQQIQQWFDGAGIRVTVASKYVQDLSTVGHSLNSGALRYEITTVRLQNDTRSVSILPEQLYRGGEKGCVTMTVNAPDRIPVKQLFYLCMAPEAGWIIRGEHQAIVKNAIMTEDIFFRAIENLA